MSESQPPQAPQPAQEQSQVQQLQQQHHQQQQQQQSNQQPTTNVATYTNNGVPIAPSSGSSPKAVPNSPLTAQQLTGQPIPQNIVIPQGMTNAGQYVQFMFTPPNPGIAMPTGGVNFAMAPQRPPAAHSGVGPRSPAMLGVVPPSPGTNMGGMHLVSPPGSQQPLSLAAPSSKSPVRPPTMSPSVANVTGQRLISAESLQQMQQMQQQFQQQQQQQQSMHQQSMHQHSQQHHSQQQQLPQHQQQPAKFYIRPIGSGMQLVSQQPSMSSQAQAMQGQSPIGTIAPSSQHQMMTHQQQQQQIISTQAMLASQPIYGQIIPQGIPLAHQQYQGQAVLTTQPMYVRPSQPPMQPIHPVNMAPKVGRPRLDQSQRKTPPGVSLAAKRQATGQARVTPIASRMSKSYTPPMNLTMAGRHEMMPKQIRARFKSPVSMAGNTAYRSMANVVRVPQPHFTRLAQSNPAPQESRRSTTGLDSARGGAGQGDTSPCQDMPQLVSTASQPLANGEGGGDTQKQKAVVKPQTLTHVIDGFIIEEGPLAFPVQASSLLTDTSDMPPKLSRVSSRESEEEVFKPASPAKAADGVQLLKCEFCGKVDKMNKFRRSMRFCSVACAKRYNVNTRHKGLKKAKQLTTASSLARKKKQMLMKRTWTRGQGRRMAVARLPHVADQADDERSTTSCSSSSQPDGDDRSSTIPSPPEGSQEVKRNNPAKWTVQEVYEFVKSMGGCEPYADLFKSQEIDGQALMLLKEDHLMSAMNMKLGPALKICARINSMKVEAN